MGAAESVGSAATWCQQGERPDPQKICINCYSIWLYTNLHNLIIPAASFLPFISHANFYVANPSSKPYREGNSYINKTPM